MKQRIIGLSLCIVLAASLLCGCGKSVLISNKAADSSSAVVSSSQEAERKKSEEEEKRKAAEKSAEEERMAAEKAAEDEKKRAEEEAAVKEAEKRKIIQDFQSKIDEIAATKSDIIPNIDVFLHYSTYYFTDFDNDSVIELFVIAPYYEDNKLFLYYSPEKKVEVFEEPVYLANRDTHNLFVYNFDNGWYYKLYSYSSGVISGPIEEGRDTDTNSEEFGAAVDKLFKENAFRLTKDDGYEDNRTIADAYDYYLNGNSSGPESELTDAAKKVISDIDAISLTGDMLDDYYSIDPVIDEYNSLSKKEKKAVSNIDKLSQYYSKWTSQADASSFLGTNKYTTLTLSIIHYPK